jgi:hypothetical protein
VGEMLRFCPGSRASTCPIVVAVLSWARRGPSWHGGPSQRGSGPRCALATGLVMALLVAGPAGHAGTEHRRVDPRTGSLEVPVEELVTAVRRKDRAEIGRVAERVGPARLAEALRRPESPVVLAALTGIVTLPGRVRLLGPVTASLTAADAGVAAAAARTLGELLAPVTVAELDDWDVPVDLVSAACGALRSTAILPVNSTAQRLATLEALGDAAKVCPPGSELIVLLHDPTPSIRRAVALVVRPQQRLATGGFASGARDVDPAVASASVAALCQALADTTAWPSGGIREPIWEQTRQLARRLAVAPATPLDDAVEMLDCLDPTLAGDRQILSGLRGARRTPMGERAADILDRAQNRARP